MARKSKSVLDIRVEFATVSIGETTARIGVKVARESLDLLEADNVLCGHRLTGRVTLGRRDDAKGQQTFDEVDYEVAGTFDVKRFGVNASHITSGLTFNLADIDVAELARFSKGVGRLIVSGVAEIPDGAGSEGDAEHEDAEAEPATA